MTELGIVIDEHWRLSPPDEGDREAYVAELNEEGIYENTLRIPRPYTFADADEWIAMCRRQSDADGQSWSWAIRDRDGRLSGGVGYVGGIELGHKAEIGYWLAKRLWGRGIMTRVVRVFCDRAEREHGLVRITGNVFAENVASARVLEKSGFEFEALARNHYRKDGRIFDGRLYARIRV
jgi:RimJ/RimL family protein N-acetyltransferase